MEGIFKKCTKTKWRAEESSKGQNPRNHPLSSVEPKHNGARGARPPSAVHLHSGYESSIARDEREKWRRRRRNKKRKEMRKGKKEKKKESLNKK